MSREQLLKLAATDGPCARLCDRLIAIEERAIISGVESGKISLHFAALRLKEKPFCYGEKRGEEKISEQEIEEKREIEVKINIINSE